MTALSPHISKFLYEYLPRDRGASQHTIDSYSVSFLQLIDYAENRLRVRACTLTIEQLTAEVILDFLEHLERDRGNTIGTRNVRLAAIKSFFRFLEHRAPACLHLADQVHAIPLKRRNQPLIDYLDHNEVQAVLDAPDPSTRGGIRDRAMLHLAYAAGLRVSELVGVTCHDLEQPGLNLVRIRGKGRRERVLPLWAQTRSVLRDWLAVRPEATSPYLFLNARGVVMTRHGFAHRLKLHADTARRSVPSIATKHITPHVLRHSCAMNTYESVGDIRKVSTWLGHSSVQSTEIYVRADPLEKLDVLGARRPPSIRKGVFIDARDRLMRILNDDKLK